jgi:hypothetical protein
MIRRLIHGSWLGLLGLVLATGAAGCGDPNESEFREGSGDKPGVADPKYAKGSPETYKQYYQDSMKKGESTKAKKSAPNAAPAAPAPTEKKE